MKNILRNSCRVYEIQTASFCNAACIICPHRVYKNILPQGVMTPDLFGRIIGQIPNRPGIKVVLYMNNEPLLDPLFLDRLKLVARRLPAVKLEISTNVSLLDSAYQEKISRIAGLTIDELRLSVFGFSPDSHHRLMPGLDWARVWANLSHLAGNRKLRQKIRQISLVMIDQDLAASDIKLARFFCRKNKFVFHLWGFLDRARNVQGLSNYIAHKEIAGCSQRRPQTRMHILFTGQVVLCCMDWAVKYVLGDAQRQSLEAIWYSRQYDLAREKVSGERPSARDFICKSCKIARIKPAI